MLSGAQKDKDKIQKKFGKHLKEVMKRKGVKPIELAKKTFLDRQQINQLRHGERNATIYTILLICRALDMTFAEFFEEFDE